MIVEAEQTITASTAAVPLHNQSRDINRQTLLIKNTSANGATITVVGVVAGASTSVKDYALAASASITISLVDYGETVTGKRSGASDATLSVLRWYSR